MNTIPSNVMLTAGQLAHLIRSAGGEIGALSPLKDLDGAPDRESSLRLPDAVAENASFWEPVARTLGTPGIALIASAGTSDNVVFLHAYASPATGKDLVGCTVVTGNTYEVVPALDARHWARLLWEGLALDRVPDGPELSAPLSHAALMACCGLVDAIKEARFEALIARERYPDPAASARSIMLAAKTGVLSQDARWFTGLVRRLLPQAPEPVSVENIREGLDELVTLGWIVKIGSDEWGFSEAMFGTAMEWSAAAVSGLFSLHVAGPDGLHRLHVGLIRTLSGLWTMECPADGQSVKLGKTGGRALMKTLARAVGNGIDQWQSPVPKNAEPNPTPPPTSGHVHFCVSCGDRLIPNAHFCTRCGAPVPGNQDESPSAKTSGVREGI